MPPRFVYSHVSAVVWQRGLACMMAAGMKEEVSEGGTTVGNSIQSE